MPIDKLGGYFTRAQYAVWARKKSDMNRRRMAARMSNCEADADVAAISAMAFSPDSLAGRPRRTGTAARAINVSGGGLAHE